MHQTDTVDCAIVLEGEIIAVLDELETVLKAADIVIQRGTNHAWSNRSGASCKGAFNLIDGQIPQLNMLTQKLPTGVKQCNFSAELAFCRGKPCRPKQRQGISSVWDWNCFQ